ncbi:MAG: hypothetical protein H7306_12110 [Bacteriovorax sp.]|nr:hypothetical protein [Rhizobacter sp.]
MTMLNLIEPQTGFSQPAVPAHPARRRAPDGLTAHEHLGFELGWDYAHHRVTQPAPYAQEPSPLRNGLLAGQAAFGTRTLAATRHVRKWLQLRLHAWLRGRSVELVQVTPNYLQQIDVSHCPITRVALSSALLSASDASVDRVRNDAGYAAGNLAVMSTKANHAKAAHGFRAALHCIQKIEAGLAADKTRELHGLTAGAPRELHGLTAEQWARVAVLCSFLEALPHDEACALPLLVLPPNRLRLFNPVQALQAFVSQQLLRPGWSRRISGFEDLLPGKPLKRDFKSFFMALLPRVIEAGLSGGGLQARWAVEDAWRSALVQQRWARFARQLSAAQCEALLASAAAHRLTTIVVVPLCDDAATDGWNLASRGYVPHAPLTDRRQAEAQRQLGW